MKKILSLAVTAAAIVCFSSFVLPLKNQSARACAFNPVTNWQLVSGSISSSGTTTSYSNLVVKNTGYTGGWTGYVRVATISGGCLPTAGEYNFFSSAGGNWVAAVTPDGDVLLLLLSGTAPSTGTSITIPPDSYTN